MTEKEYFGFKCYEYKRESDSDYLFSGKTSLRMITDLNPNFVIAYNYPAFALQRIKTYCNQKGIKCFADVTEWYGDSGKNIVFRLVKNLDTSYRMKHIHKKLDGVIAISRYLYDYYKDSVKSVLIPPTVDIEDTKWKISIKRNDGMVSFVYAGSPSKQKERLDSIVSAVGMVAKEKNVRLDIVGITREQFKELYFWCDNISESIIFWGRVDHQKALQIVKRSDWAIILRDNHRMVKAGFPTKLVESITCGTPVMANRFSNIFDYLTEENSILVKNTNDNDIAEYIIQACETKCQVDNTMFDYRNYLQELRELFDTQ